MLNADTTRRGAGAIPPILVFAAAFAWFHGGLPLTLELRDEGYLYFNIARTAAGELPHRDFIDTYGPGVYAVTAPVFDAFGGRILPVRVLMAAIRAGAVACVYLIAIHLVPRSFAVLAAFLAAAFWGRSTYFINVPYAVFFTIPLCMAGLACWLRARRRGDPAALFVAGLFCGAGLLFKWSLAAVSIYALGLSLLASEMLREGEGPGPRTARWALLSLWALAGIALVLPFLSALSPFEYLLHFAPIHGLLLVVGLGFARHGNGAAAVQRALPGALRFAAGAVIPPLLVAGLYASWGALGDLLYDVAVRPMRYRNYHTAIPAPPADSLLLLGALVAGAGTCAAALGRRGVTAGVLAALTAAAALGGGAAAAASDGIQLPLQRLELILPALTSLAALAWLAGRLMRAGDSAGEPATAAVVAVLFFQMVMTFEIFPRGDNPTAMAGTLAPMLALLAHRGFLLAGGSSGPALRRAAAAAIAVLVPGLLVAGGIRGTWRQPSAAELTDNALFAPALAGIRPKPKLYRSQHLADFDALVARLEREPFSGAPLFLMTNEPMIYFVSENPPVFPDHVFVFFLAGWGLLPDNDPATPKADELIAALASTPGAIAVSRDGDPTAEAFAAAFPEVEGYVRDHFVMAAQIGRYRLWRRPDAAR